MDPFLQRLHDEESRAELAPPVCRPQTVGAGFNPPAPVLSGCDSARKIGQVTDLPLHPRPPTTCHPERAFLRATEGPKTFSTLASSKTASPALSLPYIPRPASLIQAKGGIQFEATGIGRFRMVGERASSASGEQKAARQIEHTETDHHIAPKGDQVAALARLGASFASLH